MIILRVLQAIFLSQKKLVIYSIVCLSAALFCVNAMYGYTMQLYYSEYDATWYSTITIDNPEEVDIEDYGEYMETELGCNIGSVLYIKKIEEHNYLIGWEGGDGPEFWFPSMGGRFFDDNNMINAERVVYIDYKENEKLKDNYIDIGNEKYNVIGYGWITVYNFLSAIGKESAQEIFKVTDNGEIINEDDCFRIVPYKSFCLDHMRPQLVLIHLKDVSREKLEKIAHEMAERNSGINVSLPNSDPKENLRKEQNRFIPSAFLLSLILVFSSIGIINQLLEATREIILVFRMCGVSRIKTILYLSISMIVLFAVAEVLAISLQAAFIPALKYVNAGYLPEIQSALMMLLVMFIIALLFVLPKMVRYTSVERENIL